MRAQTAWARLDRAQEALQKCELFRDLQMRQLVEVATLAEEAMLKSIQILLEEAQPARYVFIILEGRAVAQLDTPQGFLIPGAGGTGGRGWMVVAGRGPGIPGVGQGANTVASSTYRCVPPRTADGYRSRSGLHGRKTSDQPVLPPVQVRSRGVQDQHLGIWDMGYAQGRTPDGLELAEHARHVLKALAGGHLAH